MYCSMCTLFTYINIVRSASDPTDTSTELAQQLAECSLAYTGPDDATILSRRTVTVRWDFGDEHTEEQTVDFYTDTADITYTYTEPGFYDVWANVSNAISEQPYTQRVNI